MKFYNSLTKSKDEFTVKDNSVRMYVCGPTVYNYFHIGNSRCFVVFDMLRRYLEYRGYNVTFVQNFTDVDDKLIRRAAEENSTVEQIADKYIAEYFVDAKGLGIRPATFHPRATETINEIIAFVAALIEKGHAYVAENGDVYFSAESFGEYGKLSGHKTEDLEAGARIDVNDIKRNPFDFALWKAKKDNEDIFWSAPWGDGRPGWHIECSAMVNKFLGTEIDIHGGGPDLIFPHHENEIAQSECATGKILARFWLHNGYINVDNVKMSKSAGNFFMVRDAAKLYGYKSIRYFVLASHYRSPINFTKDTLNQAKASVERLQNCQENMEFRLKTALDAEISASEAESLKLLETKKNQFVEAMDDDFNTADALGYLFEMTRSINTQMQGDVTKVYLERAYALHYELLSLLGFEKEAVETDDSEIEALVIKRTEAKKSKDFKTADEIRAKLKEMGITVEDTPQGAKWKRA